MGRLKTSSRKEIASKRYISGINSALFSQSKNRLLNDLQSCGSKATRNKCFEKSFEKTSPILTNCRIINWGLLETNKAFNNRKMSKTEVLSSRKIRLRTVQCRKQQKGTLWSHIRRSKVIDSKIKYNYEVSKGSTHWCFWVRFRSYAYRL